MLFSLLFSSLLSMVHPFFISMTEIQHNKKEHTLEISVRIFTDDLEKSLRKTNTGKVDLLNQQQKVNSELLLKAYIGKHLIIKIAGKDAALNFIGFEVKEGSIWSYFEVPNISSLKLLEVHDDILYEYQNNQMNFIHVKANGKDETEKLDYPEAYKKFDL